LRQDGGRLSTLFSSCCGFLTIQQWMPVLWETDVDFKVRTVCHTYWEVTKRNLANIIELSLMKVQMPMTVVSRFKKAQDETGCHVFSVGTHASLHL
jgi:hypothetical protein